MPLTKTLPRSASCQSAWKKRPLYGCHMSEYTKVRRHVNKNQESQELHRWTFHSGACRPGWPSSFSPLNNARRNSRGFPSVYADISLPLVASERSDITLFHLSTPFPILPRRIPIPTTLELYWSYQPSHTTCWMDLAAQLLACTAVELASRFGIDVLNHRTLLPPPSCPAWEVSSHGVS
jgi:hypothetical protein